MVVETPSPSQGSAEGFQARGTTPEEVQAQTMFAETPSNGDREQLNSDGLAAIAQNTLKHPSLQKPRVALNRPAYTIHRVGDISPPDVSIPPKARPSLDNDESPFKDWSLYNQFGTEIKKSEKESWPPANVIFQDWHVWKIIEGGIGKSTMHKHWPADFNSTGLPHTRRKPKGRAAKVEDPTTGELRYVVVLGVNGSTKLHSDEGELDPWIVVKEEDAGAIDRQCFAGSECRIQLDEALSDEELTLGINTSRYHPDKLPSNTPTPDNKKRQRTSTGLKKTGKAPVANMVSSNNTSSAKAASDSPTPANHKNVKPNNKRVASKASKTPSKVVKIGKKNSAGAAKRSSTAQSEDSEGSESESANGDTIQLEQPAKKKGSRAQVAITQSPSSTLLESPTSTQRESPAKLAMRGKSESKSPEPVQTPRITMQARRAQQPGNAFWPAEATALYQTFRDSNQYLNKGLESIANGIANACEAQDMEETDRLLTAVVARVQNMREEHSKSVKNAEKNIVVRAKGTPELKGFATAIKGYDKPTINGAATIEGKLIMPEPRLPDQSLFQTKPAKKSGVSEGFKAAMSRVKDPLEEPDMFLNESEF